jgi:hypothetical protein
MRLEIDCYHKEIKSAILIFYLLEIRMILLRIIIQVGMIIIGPT